MWEHFVSFYILVMSYLEYILFIVQEQWISLYAPVSNDLGHIMLDLSFCLCPQNNFLLLIICRRYNVCIRCAYSMYYLTLPEDIIVDLVTKTLTL